METEKEGVECVYKDKELVAIVKRDPHSKKHLVYMVREAVSDDIIGLIKHKE